MAAVKELAVVAVGTGVTRAELVQLKQEHDESFRSFAARVRGKGETCQYTTKSTYTPPKTVDFTDIIIRDVLLGEIAHMDICRDVLSTKDIKAMRDQCVTCNKNVLSQAALLPVPSLIPSTPFESIFADFFDYCGHHYLVAGDRLSGWVEIFQAAHGTAHAGAQGLITAFRTLFARFGVPEEISSDGGP